MRLHELFAITLSLVQFPVVANNINYQVDFGVIIQSDTGEPVGFEKTKKIPIISQGQTSLYGLVVTSPENNEFTLNSVHTLPKEEMDNSEQKIMGKPMLIQKRGAIFLRTDTDDTPGLYSIEIYIDNKLHNVIQYELVSHIQLANL